VPKRGAYKEFKRKTGNTEDGRLKLRVHISNVTMSAYIFPSALRSSTGCSKAQVATVRVAPEVPKRGIYKEFNTLRTGDADLRF
jgi:hypothetical protein